MKLDKLRIIALILSCLLLFALVAGCGNGKQQEEKDVVQKEGEDKTDKEKDSEQEGESQKPEPGKLPIVEEETTLTLCIPENPLVTDYKDNEFTKWLEDQTGINLEFELLPADEPLQKLELLIASEAKLPDILYMTLTGADRDNYGIDGVIIALDEYIDEYFHFFHLETAKASAHYDSDLADALLKTGRSSDGKLYAFPSMAHDPTSDYARQWYINKPWLEYLELEIPTTTDELYTVLKAFKEKDPNQNNKADEIPLIGATGWYQKIELLLLSAFTYIPYGTDPVHPFIVNDGEVDVYCNKEEYREGLRYAHKLCKGDLLSPLSFTQGREQLEAMVSLPEGEDSYVGIWAGSPTHIATPGNDRILEYEALGPVTGLEGVCWSSYEPPSLETGAHITRDCKTPEVAVCFLDFLKSEEATLRGRYGTRGEHWEYLDKDKGAKSRLHDLGYEAFFELTGPGMWGQPSDANWQNNSGLLLTNRVMAGGADIPFEDPAMQHRRALTIDGLVMRQGKRPDEIVGRLTYNQEELDKMGDIAATVNSYINESRVRFITGELDIEKDWDNYVNDLNKMGIEKYIEVTQEFYNRSNK